MKRSTDRILTTHVGSLIRPQSLQEFLRASKAESRIDENAYQKCLTNSVADVVREQADAGIDVVSDGEFGKAISWSQYALERLSRLRAPAVQTGGANPFARGADRTNSPNSTPSSTRTRPWRQRPESICVGPIKYTGQAELQRDIDNFKAALQGVNVEEAFCRWRRRPA